MNYGRAVMRVDEKSVQKAIKTLNKLSRSALPITTRNTLNDLAFKARTGMQNQVQSQFVNRNNWTKNSMRVNKATQYDVKDMVSEAGTIAKYMKTQEEGGRIKAQHNKKPIAMLAARIGNSDRNLVDRPYKMKNIKFKGKKFYTNKTKKAGIFLSEGAGKRRRIRKLWDLSNSEVNIKKNKWLEPATRKYINHTYAKKTFFKHAMNQIRKLTKQ